MKSEIAVHGHEKRVHGFFNTFAWDFHEKEICSVYRVRPMLFYVTSRCFSFSLPIFFSCNYYFLIIKKIYNLKHVKICKILGRFHKISTPHQLDSFYILNVLFSHALGIPLSSSPLPFRYLIWHGYFLELPSSNLQHLGDV